uniref:Ig-like domain-containing protein n=1 Tax=Erpetoichthys calabaricus TaxID=27687 RepID=A0A8C4SBX8_ERPCA
MLSSSGGSKQNKLSQEATANSLDTFPVTLECNIESRSSTYSLYWYIQHTRQAPKFIARKDYDGFERNVNEEKYSVALNTSSKNATLTIYNTVELSDASVYFCVLSDAQCSDNPLHCTNIREICHDYLQTKQLKSKFLWISFSSNCKTAVQYENLNTLTLAVLALRIIFIKSIVFNVLMTARAWMS